jgi:uncharacterized membrane protein
MRSGSEAFFQIAVALIPAFLFGGAMRKPESGVPSGPWIRVAIPIVVVVCVVAEIMAIRGVIDPAVNRFEQFWVVFTIVGGTVLIAGMTAWTWRSEARKPASSARQAIAQLAVVGLLVLAFLFAAWGITESLNEVDARNRVVQADRQVQRTAAAFARADQAVSSARTLLITTVVDMRSDARTRLARVVEDEVHAIDVIVQPVLRDPSPRPAIVNQAEKALTDPIGRLRDPFYATLGTGRADPERHLAALAFDRLARAERVRLAAKDSNARARRRLARACSELGADPGDAPVPGCAVGVVY